MTAFRYPRNGWYYIALHLKGFSEFVWECRGGMSSFLLLRPKTMNGTFNLFPVAEDFGPAQDSDKDDTPGATRNVFDNAVSPADDNMKALTSWIFDGSNYNSNDQDRVGGEFDESY